MGLRLLGGAGGASGVSSFNTRTGAVTLAKADVTGTGLAAADVAADAATAAVKAQRNAQTGILAPTTGGIPGYIASTVALTAGRVWAVRFYVPPGGAFTVSNMSFILRTAAGANDACDVGIWSSDLSTRIASAGSTTGKLNVASPPTIQTIALSAALAEDTVYYAVFAYGAAGSTVPNLEMITADTQSMIRLFGDNPPAVRGTFITLGTPANAVPLPSSGALTALGAFSPVGGASYPMLLLT